MTHITCRLTAKNRDPLRNRTLGNRVWAAFTFLLLCVSGFVDDVTFSHNGEFTDNWLYHTCGDINVIIVPYLCQLYVKLSYVSVTVTALKYALFVKVSDRSERFIKLTDSVLFE